MANSVDPDETAHYEPSHLDLHCLQKYLYWSAGMKALIDHCNFFIVIANFMYICRRCNVYHKVLMAVLYVIRNVTGHQ